MTASNKPQSVDAQLRSRIYGHRRGWVFTHRHFQGMGSTAAIESTLRRLRHEGVIRLLARGLYDYPVKHPVLGTVAPSADAVARALVGRDAIRLQPSGAYAANVLGLSEQVPSRIVFLTDGPSRKVKLGKQEIILKRTVPRNLAAAGRKSGTLIQALRYLGEDQVDNKVRSILLRQITEEDRPALRRDLRHAPAWIADLLRPLADQVPNP
jgi:hypothetical protein